MPTSSFLRLSTRTEDEQIGGSSALGQHRAQSTWLAFTLLHAVFPSESTAASSRPLLDAIRASGDMRGAGAEDSASPYLLKVLAFLDLGCGVGLTRAAVNLLKKMMQVRRSACSSLFIHSKTFRITPRACTVS